MATLAPAPGAAPSELAGPTTAKAWGTDAADQPLLPMEI